MATNPFFGVEPARPPAADEVQVWRFALPAAAAQAQELGLMLTPEEQARAARFRIDADRWRFQMARAATRFILAGYLGVPPQDVAIGLNQFGKPELDAATLPIERRVHFNASHSGDWIVLAFAGSFPVGIDVEQSKAERVTQDLIEQVLCEAEQAALQRLPAELRTAAFFNCWTSKEALVKGLGLGLNVPVRAIEVAIDPRQPARLIDAPPEHRPESWRLRRLEICGPYSATLAFRAPSAQIVEMSGDPPGRPA